MIDEPREISSGETVSEWMDVYRNDLKDNGAGLWAIVEHGRVGFGLSGDALLDFIRRSLRVVIAAGGQIVKDGPDGWEPDDSYGATPDEIVENVIRAWQAAGEPEPEWGEWWFVLPKDFRRRD